MVSAEILFFLNYGYFPNYDPKFKSPSVNKMDLTNKSYKELQADFVKLLSESLKKAIENIPNEKLIVIPLSGGLDSRAILAEVLNQVEINRVVTYTFGTKGSYDFEIGNEVARKAKVRHHEIELNNFLFSQQDMIKTAKFIDHQSYLFHHPDIKILNEIIGDNVVISGYLGDLIFGSYADVANSDIDAVDWYLRKMRFKDAPLPTNTELFKQYLNPIDYNSIVTPIEQMILYERAPKLTAPHILMNNWTYETPLIDKKIMDFMFSLPVNLRKGEGFFIETMMEYYPEFFNMRAKGTYGKNLSTYRQSHYSKRIKNKIILFLNKRFGFNICYPSYNYIDFNKEILERKDLRKIFKKNLQDLSDRRLLEIDPVSVYKKHQKTKDKYEFLINLVSLEIILKSKKI